MLNKNGRKYLEITQLSIKTILLYIHIVSPCSNQEKNSGLKIKKPCIGPAGYFSVSMLLVLKSIREPAKATVTYYTRSTRVLHINFTISLSLYGVGRTKIPPNMFVFF